MIRFSQLCEAFRPDKEFTSDVGPMNSMPIPKSDAQLKWRASAEKIASKYNFNPVGTGNYAAVFRADNYPYVIKVFVRDTAYLKWLSFAKANPHNPYVPKIKGKVLKLNSQIMAVRLERLVSAYKASGRPDTQSVMKLQAIDSHSNINPMTSDRLYQSDPDFRAVCDEIYTNKNVADVHGDNIMLRPGSLIPVIVDPYYNWFRNGANVIDPNDLSSFADLF